MEVEFDATKLAKKCATEKSRAKAFGQERGKRLGRRLSALLAAANLGDLKGAPGRLHALKGNLAGKLSLDLDGPYRLIFEPVVESEDDVDCSNPAEWGKITRVRILSIEDTHE